MGLPVETWGILLRVTPYRESSAILRFLTRDRGVVAFAARGVRGGGKGASVPGVFGSGLLSYRPRPDRELQSLGSWRPGRSGLELGRDLRTLGAAAILAEAVLLTSGEEPDPGLHDLILGALEALEAGDGSHAPRLLLPAGWALMEHLGFSPVVDRCAHCGRSLVGEGILTFRIALGGMVCGECHRSTGADRGGPRLGPLAREQLSRMVSGESPEELQGEVPHVKLLRNFMEFHLGARRPMASFDFLLDQLA